MDRYICIHGHFYQPPRENPWLEFVEREDSAHPYHDWNERITYECYAPNGASRILNGDRHIIAIVNNYSKISFNFGPTLLGWMEKNFPWVYESLLAADQVAMKNFNGHGSAIAQVYNHVIMPLASYRDKKTQVLWGIRDFERRFKRFPEGMWLPETAVDMETLEVLAESGIKFTILAPHQAGRVRPLEGGNWVNITAASLDKKKAYLCRLPSGREIAIFFYDGPIAQDVAFGGLLQDGKLYAQRLVAAFEEEDYPQLVNVATDGETYGHHHRFGDMALAYCIYSIESQGLAKMTVYGEFLEKFPPQDEVEILENTSWSCAHGVKRWCDDCGCSTGSHPGWNQKWRRPLRQAVESLSKDVSRIYEDLSKGLLSDPWSARDDYVEVVLDRTVENVEGFFRRNAAKELAGGEKVVALKLLEMTRNAMLMFTSCGWFFDDISGIETAQIMKYAARAIQLAKEAGGRDLEGNFMHMLEEAKSNDPTAGDGRAIYERAVLPKVLDLSRVCAHGVMSSMFIDGKGNGEREIYCYRLKSLELKSLGSGKFIMNMGKASVHSTITWEEALLQFASCYIGGLQLFCGVSGYADEISYREMLKGLQIAFENHDVPDMVRKMDRHFGGRTFTLKHLFRDEQCTIVNNLVEDVLDVIMITYEELYDTHYPAMKLLNELNIPLPDAFRATVDVVLSGKLNAILESPNIDLEELAKVCGEIKEWNVAIDRHHISRIASERVSSLLKDFKERKEDFDLIFEAGQIIELLTQINVTLDLWKAQNIYFDIVADMLRHGRPLEGNVLNAMRRLGLLLGVMFPV